ncbi:RsmB/NOP family class I SAM-dependent RNA methyltransferase [Corynebacterium liangguodongii]|uniref:MFS transporter n=1 Tax=Corynebacterium liangguodongii TaxID=2079535 RepID=A0A2S0WE59_9CORY|nr:transcription antitermination factor NusB [Corynebacterium liangguodongii]AWB84067.1 MFS transporter [Corynebacterium liangguodongii]PWC00078.1 MFS transporter [Corynebacterium liangguodongii]
MSGGFRSRAAGRRSQKAEAAPQSGQPRAAEVGSIGDAAREAAFDVVLRVATDEAFANLVLPKLLRSRRISGRDAAFATELAYGTLRTQGVIDAVIERCSSRPLGEIAPEVLAALRLGTYQLLYMRVDAHAAVDTSVRLVEAAGVVKAKGFANAVLRSVSRTPAPRWIHELAPADELGAVAFRTAHPEWIARSFSTALGPDRAAELERALEADSQRPVVHLVARPGEISAAELAAITGGEEGKYSPYAVYLPEGDPGSLEPVRSGLAGVQDEGSQLIARAVAEVEVEDDAGRWLDLCAGPGGKAALLGAIAGIEGARVDAVEVSEHRAELVRKAVGELPVRVTVGDGRDPGLDPGFDRVLVDAPCSGLGALRRRPEARWVKSEADIASLTDLQGELLASAIRLVRPGGVVVYSTCSPDLRETRGVVEAAVAAGGVEELDAHPYVPGLEDAGEGKSVQMWPHRHGTDAMFFSVLRKK